MPNIFKSASPIRVGNFTSAPADVSAGALYWDTTAVALYVADGSTYNPVSGGGSTSFLTNTFRLEDFTDPTKKIAFDAAAIATATVRTITMPNANVDLGNLTNSNIAAAAAIAGTKISPNFGSQNVSTTGTLAGSNFSGSSSGTNTGDQTNISGTAGNITASSNSTLTTLSALSLPGSQVTGNISGNAANVTGTVAIANGGTGQTTAAAAYNALSPMTTTGDLEYESATNVASRLAIGTAGQVLTVSGGLPVWMTPGGGTSFPLLAPNDTAGAPSYSFTNSTTTGVYRFAADSLGFSTNGVSAGHIDSSQSWVFAGTLNFNSQVIKWNDATIVTNNGDPVSLTNTTTNATNGFTFNTYPYIGLTLTGGQTAATEGSLTFPGTNQKGCKIDYVIYDTTSTHRRVGTLYVVANAALSGSSTLVSIIDNSTETGDVGVSWTAVYASNQVQIQYTTNAGNKTMSAVQTIYATNT